MGKKAKVNDSKYQSLKTLMTDKRSWRSQQIIKGRCVTDKQAFLNTSEQQQKISNSGIHINVEDTNNDETRRKGMTAYLSSRPNVEEVSLPCAQCYWYSRKPVSYIKEDVSHHLLTQTTFTPASLNNLHLRVLKEPDGEQLVLIFLEILKKWRNSPEVENWLQSSEVQKAGRCDQENCKPSCG